MKRRTQPVNIQKRNCNLPDDLSCSMIVDYKKDYSTTPPEKDFISTKLNTIYPKSNGKWIDSSLILQCQLCSVSFGIFNRKHQNVPKWLLHWSFRRI